MVKKNLIYLIFLPVIFFVLPISVHATNVSLASSGQYNGNTVSYYLSFAYNSGLCNTFEDSNGNLLYDHVFHFDLRYRGLPSNTHLSGILRTQFSFDITSSGYEYAYLESFTSATGIHNSITSNDYNYHAASFYIFSTFENAGILTELVTIWKLNCINSKLPLLNSISSKVEKI